MSCRCWFFLLLVFWSPFRLSGQGVLSPRVASLVAGRTLAFRVLQAGPGHPVPLAPDAYAWRVLEGPGAIGEATGVFEAPHVEEPILVQVQATPRLGAEPAARATLLILPYEPFALVEQVLGPDWLVPMGGDLPWLDPETGLRPPGACPALDQADGAQRWVPIPVHYAGVGVPFQARWRIRPGFQLLAYRDGPELIRQEVTGLGSRTLTALGPLREFWVETLSPGDGTAPAFVSQRHRSRVHLRGLAPFARGLGAPFGLARLPNPGSEAGYLVTDPSNHVIRRLSPAGAVTTPWGEAGHAGHLDNAPGRWERLVRALGCGFLLDPPSQATRFDTPTFLVAETARGFGVGWQRCLVADTGNQVIRELRPDGSVRTLAGVVGKPGHRDGRAQEALFHKPMGLALDDEGNVYVADQGNAVIRRIDPGGEVSTLAGQPGVRGSQDGVGAGATFTRPQGLAIGTPQWDDQELFVTDGHALRLVHLPEGQVETVLGVVDQPGYRQVRQGTPTARREALRQPCLTHPCGIAIGPGDQIHLADQGNHCVRTWARRRATLATVAGDPSLPETRWGLVRDALEAPLDERFAALEAPSGLVTTEGPDRLLVSTGDSLGELCASGEARDGLTLEQVSCSNPTLGAACEVRFTALAQDIYGLPTARPFHYQVDFLEADGTLAWRSEGDGQTPWEITAAGQFGLRGRARIVVRCVTDQGVSEGRQAGVQVR